uniref:Uncharacterized protein n=1 Tax=Thermosporothrix sp. COM3 TaxID=2490863 RepID=A0A455SDG7_9CHLR|nr:hypothetical protein KTC_01020 [Thermosporothrix sp. COM3]
MDQSLLQAVQALAQARDVALGGNVTDEPVDWEIEACSTTVFRSYTLYRVVRWVKWMYETWYLGWTPGQDPYWLEGDPVSFLNMAQADGVCLESVAAIWEYAEWYLVITQHQHYWDEFLLIESVDQARFLDDIDADMTPLEIWRKETFKEQYRSRIGQPSLFQFQQTTALEVFALHGRNLELHHLLLDRSGYLSHTRTVLETDLPLAVAGYGSRSLISGYIWHKY